VDAAWAADRGRTPTGASKSVSRVGEECVLAFAARAPAPIDATAVTMASYAKSASRLARKRRARRVVRGVLRAATMTLPHSRSLLLAATLVLARLATGCSGVAAATPQQACDQYCTCAQCDSSGNADCLGTLAGFEQSAEQKGCPDKFDAFVTCVAADTTCTSQLLGAGCMAALQTLEMCTQQ
jgi:hypothetical protein